MGFEYFQKRRFQSISGQLVSVFFHPQFSYLHELLVKPVEKYPCRKTMCWERKGKCDCEMQMQVDHNGDILYFFSSVPIVKCGRDL